MAGSGARVLQASQGGDPRFGPKVLQSDHLSKVSPRTFLSHLAGLTAGREAAGAKKIGILESLEFLKKTLEFFWNFLESLEFLSFSRFQKGLCSKTRGIPKNSNLFLVIYEAFRFF